MNDIFGVPVIVDPAMPPDVVAIVGEPRVKTRTFLQMPGRPGWDETERIEPLSEFLGSAPWAPSAWWVVLRDGAAINDWEPETGLRAIVTISQALPEIVSIRVGQA